MDFSKLSMNYKIAGIAGIVGIIGMILPWAGASYGGFGISFSGFEVGGLWTWLFLLGCIGAIALAFFSMSGQSFFPQQKKLGLLIAGGVAAIAMIISLLSAISGIGYLGIGFWLCLVVGLVLAYFGFMEFQKN